MGFKKTLASILAPIIITGSMPSCQPTYAQSEKVQKDYTEKTQNVSVVPEEGKTISTFHREIPVKLYQYQQHNQKEVPAGDTVVVLEGGMDYETGRFTLSYSSGRMTADGPDLSRFSRNEIERLQMGQLIPRLNDSESLAILVASSSEGIKAENIEQWGWLTGIKENPKRLVPSNQKFGDSIFLYAGNEGIDFLTDLLALKLSGGLTKIWDETITDLNIPEKYKVDASRRAREYFQKLASEALEEKERRAESSLEKGVSIGFVPLFKDPRFDPIGRHLIARTIELDLKNNTFEDQYLSFVFDKILIGQKSSQDDMIGTSAGTKYGEINNVAVKVMLPSHLTNYFGRWVLFGGLDNGKPLSENRIEPMVVTIGLEGMLIKSFEETISSGPLINLTESTLGAYFSESKKGAILRMKSPDQLLASIVYYMKDSSAYPRSKDLEETFNKDVMFFKRITTPEREFSYSEEYFGEWRMRAEERVSVLEGSSREPQRTCTFMNDKLVFKYGTESITNNISWINLPLENYSALKVKEGGLFVFLKKIDKRKTIMSPSIINQNQIRRFGRFLELDNPEFIKEYLEGIFSDPGIVLEK